VAALNYGTLELHLSNADAVIVMFSVNWKPSFAMLDTFFNIIARTKVPCRYLVGHKCDYTLTDKKISTYYTKRKAQQFNAKCAESSAKLNINVDTVWKEIIEMVLKQRKSKQVAHS